MIISSADKVPLEKCPALVLNADFRPLSYYPLSIWCWQDAVKSVFLDRVSIVSNYKRKIRSTSFEMNLPSYAKTGVEMEARMGVNAALITIYDLSKIVNPHLRIDNVKLLIKEGGKSGLWKNPDGLPNFLKDFF